MKDQDQEDPTSVVNRVQTLVQLALDPALVLPGLQNSKFRTGAGPVAGPFLGVPLDVLGAELASSEPLAGFVFRDYRDVVPGPLVSYAANALIPFNRREVHVVPSTDQQAFVVGGETITLMHAGELYLLILSDPTYMAVELQSTAAFYASPRS